MNGSLGKPIQDSCLSLYLCIRRLPLSTADYTAPPAEPHLLVPPPQPPKPLTSINNTSARPAPEPPKSHGRTIFAQTCHLLFHHLTLQEHKGLTVSVHHALEHPGAAVNHMGLGDVLAAELEVCDATDEARRTNLAMRTQPAALACHATFDVSARHHASVLSDDGEAALLIESAVRAAEHAAPPELPEKLMGKLGVWTWKGPRLAKNAEI
jgi:hypothetical protein